MRMLRIYNVTFELALENFQSDTTESNYNLTLTDTMERINNHLLKDYKLNLTRKIAHKFTGSLKGFDSHFLDMTSTPPKEPSDFEAFIDFFYNFKKDRLAATFVMKYEKGDICMLIGKFPNEDYIYQFEISYFKRLATMF